MCVWGGVAGCADVWMCGCVRCGCVGVWGGCVSVGMGGGGCGVCGCVDVWVC